MSVTHAGSLASVALHQYAETLGEREAHGVRPWVTREEIADASCELLGLTSAGRRRAELLAVHRRWVQGRRHKMRLLRTRAEIAKGRAS